MVGAIPAGFVAMSRVVRSQPFGVEEAPTKEGIGITAEDNGLRRGTSASFAFFAFFGRLAVAAATAWRAPSPVA